MEIIELTPEAALGPLNEVEKKNAPNVLYCTGDLGLLRNGPRVSIVGSRKVSDKGYRRASVLAKMLVEHGVTVVSGLADGVDTAGHRSAIENGGRTIAVLGTSLDKSYPASNRELQAEIASSHLLISQFAIGRPGGRKNFPMRNRTMALISDATVIVEAQDGSGSLHQGWEALRLGRPLFLMESIVQDASLAWPEEMVSYGAQELSRDGFENLIELLPTASREELAAIAF
jgi:DNA processing protein